MNDKPKQKRQPRKMNKPPRDLQKEIERNKAALALGAILYGVNQ